MTITYNSHPFGLLTYTSPSDKWVRRASGLWQKYTAGSELPYRWNTSGTLRGVLCESQRTNLLTRSEEFDNAAWTKTGGSISANATTAPSGDVTADLLTEDTSTGSHFATRSVACSAATAYTYSVFYKPNGRTKVRLHLYDGGYVARCVFTCTGSGSAAVVTGSATITAEANGWYRLTITGTTTGTTFSECFIGLCDAAGASSYTGDGASGAYLWGAQLEAGGFVSSYIQTTSATVTRARDQLTLAASGVPTSISQGTLYAEIVDATGTATGALPGIYINLGGADQYASYKANGGTDARGFLHSGAYVFGNLQGASASAKVAFAWAQDDAALYAGGSQIGTDSSGTPVTPAAGTFAFGNDTAADYVLTLARVAYFARRRTNAELASLTT